MCPDASVDVVLRIGCETAVPVHEWRGVFVPEEIRAVEYRVAEGH